MLEVVAATQAKNHAKLHQRLEATMRTAMQQMFRYQDTTRLLHCASKPERSPDSVALSSRAAAVPPWPGGSQLHCEVSQLLKDLSTVAQQDKECTA